MSVGDNEIMIIGKLTRFDPNTTAAKNRRDFVTWIVALGQLLRVIMYSRSAIKRESHPTREGL